MAIAMTGMDEWTAAMRAGDHVRAWRLSAEALAARDPAERDDPRRPYHERWVWDGRPFDGRDLLVRCYHGLGDTLQFARFLPLLADRAASVTVEVQPALLDLLAAAFPGIGFHPFDPARPRPPAACDIEIAELPFALRARPGDVRAAYLARAPMRLPPGTIGLCHTTGGWRAGREMPQDLLAPIASARPCVTLAMTPSILPVLNPEGCSPDIAATAALVAGCALVVTVDTMIAHLAGALGRPAWVMLQSKPDWRWNPAARTSDWYPAARLYVQPAAGDWESVVAEIGRDLATACG